MGSDSNYRSDIDGLRGVAILAVLAFHCFSVLLPGGFIGVDVFFVISGYLITSIILKDLLNNRFSIASFYSRRIKRIFPALITVLVATWALGWLFLFPCEFKNLGKHIMGGAAFSANILLWRETNYFADFARSKPLLHLWSLGIEEQFYLFFPILLWFIVRKALVITRFLVFLFAISLALSFYGTLTHPSATFYLPVTRLWELLIGCTLASIERGRKGLSQTPADNRIPPPVLANIKANHMGRTAVSCLGLSLIIGSGFWLNKTIAFPGAWALLPTLGTALAILAGKESRLNQWILSNNVLVGIGLISYPLYLWHWPLLFFARTILPAPIPSLAIAGIMVGSLLLAFLTFWFIERPIRFGAFSASRSVRILSVCMVGLLVLGIVTQGEIVSSRLGANPLCREASEAMVDWDYPFADNDFTRDFRIDAEIAPGHTGQATLFVGDSHMQHYWPRVEMVLKSSPSNSRPVFFITAGGCPTLPNVNRIRAGFACDKFFDYAMQEAARTNIGTVVFTCFWEQYFIGGFPEGVPDPIYRSEDKDRIPLRLGSPAAQQVFHEFGQSIAKLVGMGKEVVVILSSPTSSAWDPRKTSRIALHKTVTNDMRMLRKEFESFVRPVKKALLEIVVANGGKVIDPLDYFEEDGFLNGKTPGGKFRYMDGDHLRPFYAREKALFLDPLLHGK
jgi:peptidoglycan/LPS O-acetylase OafA/YrhL